MNQLFLQESKYIVPLKQAKAKNKTFRNDHIYFCWLLIIQNFCKPEKPHRIEKLLPS